MNYKLKDLIEVTHGYAFKSEYFSEEPTENILLSPGNVNIGGGFNLKKKKYYHKDAEINPNYVFLNGDIFITMTDLSKEGDTLGYPAKVPKNMNYKFLHNQRLGRVFLKKKHLLDLDFLYYSLCTREYRGYILGTATGSTVKHTSPTKILEYELVVPEFNLQKKISSILSNLDEKILLNKKNISSLEQLSQSLFKQWFIDFEFPNEKGKPYKSSGGELKDSINGDIPINWDVIFLKDALQTIIDYRGKTPKKLGSDWVEKGIPAISAKNIKNKKLINIDKIKYVSEETYSKWMKIELEKGDVLLTSEAPLGETFYLAEKEKYCLSQRLFALRVNTKLLNSTYLWELVNSNIFQYSLQGKATGSTVQGIRQKELMKIPIILPEKKSLDSFEKLVRPILEKTNCLIKENEKLAELRDTLLPKLLSGEIEIPDDLEV